MVWKKEKEINQMKYTNNIFPEAGKIVQSHNQLQIKSYSSQVTQSNTETKYEHSCSSCHNIKEKLVTLSTENLPKFFSKIKSTLSEPTQPKRSTSKLIESNLTPPPRESASQLAPPQKSQSLKSPVSQGNRSPKAKSHSTSEDSVGGNQLKNYYWVLEDEKLIEYEDLPPSPTFPTP